MNINKQTKNMLFFLLSLIYVLFQSSALAAPEKIRVGSVFSMPFFNIDENHNVTGYGYDYLKKITPYTNWRYEYIEISSLTDAFKMLQNHEIDLLGPIAYDPSLADVFAYANHPSIKTTAAVYVKTNNSAIPYGDLSALQGQKIGLLPERVYSKNFMKLCKQNDLRPLFQFYDSPGELFAAFENGEVAAILALDIHEPQKLHATSVLTLDEQELYFVTEKTAARSRQIMAEFNQAQQKLNSVSPYWEVKLHQKYFRETNVAFTSEELAYIGEHAGQPFIVVYDPDWAPIEFYDSETKTMEGITADIFRYIADYSGLEFEFKRSSSFTEAIGWLEAGKADLLSALGTTDTSEATLSDSYLTIPSVLIQRQHPKSDGSPVLILPQNYFTNRKHLTNLPPNVTVIYAPSITDCFDAVAAGDADMTYTNNYVASIMMQDYKYRFLVSTLVRNSEDNLHIGLPPNSDPLLLSILNKSLQAIPEEMMSAFILQNSVKQSPQHSLLSLIQRNSTELLIIAFTIFLLTLCIFTYILVMKNRYNRTIEKLAFVDDLTGMWNYNKFKKEAALLLKSFPENSYAILYLDISKFKYINSSFGFEIGNRVLKYVAAKLAENITIGNIFARVSADQFILMLHYKEKIEIVANLRNLYKKLQAFPRTQATTYTLNFTCGISLIEDSADKNEPTVNTAIDQALMAQRTLKGVHGNSYAFYQDAFREQIIKEKNIEDIMEQALLDHEFIIYYQPKYDLPTMEISGAEALVRWKNPLRGMIYPNDFIPLFEKNGFIVNLDFYVLNSVCHSMQQWLHTGKKPFPVSVNISRLHINNQSFMRQLLMIVDQYALPHSLIELEITESAFLENAERLQKFIRQLKKLDFIVSMDDFGSGYSSLNLLKELPFDVLKIDKDFFQKGYSTEREQIIISSIVEMSQKLNIKVVAEGVETVSQMNFLKKIKCDMAQGYFFSKPIELSEFLKKF